MNEGQTSNVVNEVASQGASGIQTSAVSGEVLNRTTDDSYIQTSAVSGEVLNRTSVESPAVTSNIVVEVLSSVDKYSERLHPLHSRRYK